MLFFFFFGSETVVLCKDSVVFLRIELTLMIFKDSNRGGGYKVYTLYQLSNCTLNSSHVLKINRVVRVKLKENQSVSAVHGNERS